MKLVPGNFVHLQWASFQRQETVRYECRFAQQKPFVNLWVEQKFASGVYCSKFDILALNTSLSHSGPRFSLLDSQSRTTQVPHVCRPCPFCHSDSHFKLCTLLPWFAPADTSSPRCELKFIFQIDTCSTLTSDCSLSLA